MSDAFSSPIPSRFRAGLLAPLAAGSLITALSLCAPWSNLSQAHVSLSRSLSSNLSALSEAYRAPSDGSVTRSTLAMARELGQNFLAGPAQLAPARSAPHALIFQSQYVGPDDLNAHLITSRQTVQSGDRVLSDSTSQTLLVETDSAGRWFLEDHPSLSALDPASARHAAASFTVAHEMAHALFATEISAQGGASIERSLQALDAQTSAYTHLLDIVAWIHHRPWSHNVINESFADCMALSFIAKTLPRDQFDRVVEAIRDQRGRALSSEISAISNDLSSSSDGQFHPAHVMSDHVGSKALGFMLSRGWSELRSMTPEQASSAAMDSAHLGFIATAASYPDTFGVASEAPLSSLWLSDLFDQALLFSQLSARRLLSERDEPAPRASSGPSLAASAIESGMSPDLQAWRRARHSHSPEASSSPPSLKR